MIEKVTDAIVDAEGFTGARELTYVLIHDVLDGGWGFKGRQHRSADYMAVAPAPLAQDATPPTASDPI